MPGHTFAHYGFVAVMDWMFMVHEAARWEMVDLARNPVRPGDRWKGYR